MAQSHERGGPAPGASGHGSCFAGHYWLAFGYDFGAVEELSTGEESAYSGALKVIVQYVMDSVEKLPWHFFNIFAWLRMRRALALYTRTAQEIIATERKHIGGSGSGDATSRSVVARLYRGSLGDAAKGEVPLSSAEILENVVGLMIAGHETTSNTACWCFYLLAANPETQEMLRGLLLEHWPVREQPPAWEDLKELDFLKGVVYEALRFYPTIQGVAKSSPHAQEVAGLTIPPGVLFLPNKALWGKCAELFPEPEVFDPLRFRRGEFGARGDNIAAWGGGPRHCIGYKLAEAELQVMLAHLLRSFRIAMPPGAPPPQEVDDITLGPKACGLPLVFTPIQ